MEGVSGREELNGGGQGAGVGGTQLKKARATLLSVGSRHTSSRVSRTHVASLKSSLSLSLTVTRPSLPRSTIPFRTLCLISFCLRFFFALSSISTTINMYKYIYTYVEYRRAIFKKDDSKMIFRFFFFRPHYWKKRGEIFMLCILFWDAILSKSGRVKIWGEACERFVILIYIIRIDK